MDDADFQALREAMLRQAFLFDDPYSYRCGVEDALAGVAELVRSTATVRELATA